MTAPTVAPVRLNRSAAEGRRLEAEAVRLRELYGTTVDAYGCWLPLPEGNQ